LKGGGREGEGARRASGLKGGGRGGEGVAGGLACFPPFVIFFVGVGFGHKCRREKPAANCHDLSTQYGLWAIDVDQ